MRRLRVPLNRRFLIVIVGSYIPANAVWELVDGDRVLDRITYDREIMQYRDSRGESLGPDWVHARSQGSEEE